MEQMYNFEYKIVSLQRSWCMQEGILRWALYALTAQYVLWGVSKLETSRLLGRSCGTKEDPYGNSLNWVMWGLSAN